MTNEKKRKRLSLPMTEAQHVRFDRLAEAMGSGITTTNVAVLAVGIGLPLLESAYLNEGQLPPLFKGSVAIDLQLPPGRGRPRTTSFPPGAMREDADGRMYRVETGLLVDGDGPANLEAGDEVFPSKRGQATIAELGARAKLLGFKIVDDKKATAPRSPALVASDVTELERLTAPAPKPPPVAQVPGPSRTVANVVAPAPEPMASGLGAMMQNAEDAKEELVEKAESMGVQIEQTPGTEADHASAWEEPYPEDKAIDRQAHEESEDHPDMLNSDQLDAVSAPEAEPEADEDSERRDLVKEKLTELLEAGVPIEDAYEQARKFAGGSDDEGNGAVVTPIFADPAAPEGPPDQFKCVHNVRFDAPEQCGACVEAGF